MIEQDDIREFWDENQKLLILIGSVGFFAYSGGYIQYDPPGYWPIFLAIGAAAFGVGIVAARAVMAMFPDEFPIWVVAFDGAQTGGTVYELTEDQFEAMSTEPADGVLMQWDSAKPTYEVRSYDPNSNHAVLNWRVPGSKLAQHATVDEALEQIDDLQGSYERDARRGRWIQRRLPSIVRRLDRQRARDQMEVLEGHVSPSLDGSTTISDVIREVLPEELIPESKRTDKDAMTNGDGDDEIISWDQYEEPMIGQRGDIYE
ncbi:hypothetical protein [Halalkalirubrum salinum]|uniref:hypothetical protein n=1 Tax=Halalkalirubrum salinum TaxID=2563889 RepID=UPI0010FAF6B4|nr:hypothetical protein [Halalkalirubrum salinum]